MASDIAPRRPHPGRVSCGHRAEGGTPCSPISIDAGRRLAEELSEYADQPDTVVLGIPRGGVVVAAEVARELHLPLDIVLAAKVGAPGNPEFAAGALTADGELLANPAVGSSAAELDQIADGARAKIARQLTP